MRKAALFLEDINKPNNDMRETNNVNNAESIIISSPKSDAGNNVNKTLT